MTNTNEDLGNRIEQMIAEHIAAARKMAKEAVERAFAASTARSVMVARPIRARENGKRRAASELAALGEQFYRAACAKPGETMTVLAAEVGVSARELHRAVARLKQAGRVRAVGQRSQTRYFPMASGTAATA
jgi:hypothetical protein